MADMISVVLGVFQIFLQLVAAWYAYLIMRLMGIARFWILLIIALLFMGLRRLTALTIELEIFPSFTGWVAFLDRLVLPFLISVFLLAGMYELHARLKRRL